MSMHLTQCPKCTSTDLEIIEELNPDTCDLNMNVIAKCNECKHIFETRVTSHRTQWEYDHGLAI